jgi:beta-lactam-binding protein with PASTA domain
MSTRERSADPTAPTELIGPPAPPPGEPPPDRELWPWLLVLAVLLLAGLAAAWYATRDSGTAAPRTIQTTVAAPAKPKPKPAQPDTTTAPRTTQPQTVVVPDLVDQSRADALRTLEAQGLRPDVREVPSTETKDTVVSQHPAGGTRVDAEAAVLLNVAKPVEKRKPAKPVEKRKPAKPEESKPKAAEPTTTVSEAGATATVPSVVGEDKETAKADLKAAGFSPEKVEQDTTDPSEDGIVVDQAPAGGTTALRKSHVTIYVGRFERD